MIKIDPTVTSYKLNILSTTRPIRQSPMFSPESSENYLNRSRKDAKSRFYQRGNLLGLVNKCGGGTKER